jgi:hypothetical protein
MEGCALSYGNLGPLAQSYQVPAYAPQSAGGVLHDGTYVLRELDYYYGPALSDAGAKIPITTSASETLILQGSVATLVSGTGSPGTGLGVRSQQAFAVSTGAIDCQSCGDSGVVVLALVGICGTSSRKTFYYTSKFDGVDGGTGRWSLILHALWPDGGQSLEVRTYTEL